MRSTPVRHECTRSKVHGERLMISKYESAVWPPHSAEVYIGFERASSCPRLISPTPIYIPLYIYIYISTTRADFQLTCAFSRFTRILAMVPSRNGVGPSQDHVWQGTRRKGRVESPRQTARSPLLDFQRSVLDRGCRVTVSSRAHFVLVDAWKRLTNFGGQ